MTSENPMMQSTDPVAQDLRSHLIECGVSEVDADGMIQTYVDANNAGNAFFIDWGTDDLNECYAEWLFDENPYRALAACMKQIVTLGKRVSDLEK